MGSICSTAQSSRDHDSISNSESSPCYRGRQQGRRRTSSGAHVTGPETKHDRNGKMEKEEKQFCETIATRSGPFSRLVEESREESSFASESDTTFTSPPTSAQLHRPEPDANVLFANSAPRPIRHLPENVRQLIDGQINAVRMVDRGANVALFIAQTDNQDYIRDVMEKLSSDLETYATTKGVSLQVSCLQPQFTVQHANNHTTQLSLSTLARLLETTYVLPVLFFTNSVGSALLPETIEVQDFQTALTINGSEQERHLLLQWYKLDEEGQPPCYRLQSSFQLDKEKEEHLLELLLKVFSPELRDIYLTTLFEQVVHNSVCMSQEIARRCVLIQRQEYITSPLDDSIQAQEYARKVAALHKTLKNLLLEKNIFRTKQDFCYSEVLANLRQILDEIVEDIDNKDPFKMIYSVPRPLLEEISQHISFCQKAAVCSVNRESSLQIIKNYIMGDGSHPLIIYGPHGSGKTTLIARAAQSCHSWKPESGLVLRFTGVSADSRSLANLLNTVAKQCALLLNGQLPHVPHSVEAYKAALQDLFTENQNMNKTVIILLDGIDQMEDFQETVEIFWSWIPRELPQNMKLILTVHNNENYIQQLKNHVSNPSAFDEIQPLTHNEASNLFRACILQHVHTAIHPDSSVTMGTELKQSTIPLNVKIHAWHSSLLHSALRHKRDSPETRTNFGDFSEFLSDIETVYGRTEVARICSLIAASRYGLSEHEIQKMAKPESADLWCKLAFVMSPFLKRILVGDLALFSWRDASIRTHIIDRYLNDLSDKQQIHATILAYFKDVWNDWNSPQSDTKRLELRSSNLRLLRRALDEIPFQLLNAGQSQSFQDLFRNFSWLLAKTSQSGINQVIEDMKLLLTESNCDQNRCLAQIFQLSAPSVDYDYRQLYAQIKGRISLQKAELHSLEHWVQSCQDPLVPCLIPSVVCLNSSVQDPAVDYQTCGSGECYFNGIYRLMDDERHAVALSTLNDEMSLWDFQTGECVKTLGNLHQPSKIVTMAHNRCVVLCGRELRVFDISSGREILKLKGIMNQKLPLFGIHGDAFVVSLSRNRMYVNLISLENGDCVTTFKVGEDRFLNSLLVSENGRILVCGDESKRPCSLLVWDLQARKLIYDLKMNHHEFVTKNSAITAEGTYVCCVCKELETTDPNFIVVYDLQSGTLFKKWKAAVNTVALTIACQNTCVISSLEDCRILVWDLVTGNCKWTLTGHSYSPDVLTLDTTGNILLSRDSENNDKSLRLWDLSTGNYLASFTPDETITATQLSADGRSVLVALLGRPGLVRLHLHL